MRTQFHTVSYWYFLICQFRDKCAFARPSYAHDGIDDIGWSADGAVKIPKQIAAFFTIRLIEIPL